MNDIYTTQINESIASLFANMEQRISAEDMQRVRDAYALAAEAHREQRRKTGEPYIIHPIAVARIVAEELELGANPVIAAFLHDVVEDTDYTIEDIRERFGDDVAFLVGVVTKQKKDKYEKSKQVDNFRQILASVQYDVRAILIKLADRLHNMRTLDSMRPDKQMKIAGETDYFYAPLANRLGLYHIKSELENLSFRYRCPREYAEIEALLEKEKEENKEKLNAFVETINGVLSPLNRWVYVEVRYRTPYSVWRKMQTSGCDFNHVDGKHYVRIVFDSTRMEENNTLGIDMLGLIPMSFNKQDEKKKAIWIYSDLTSVFKERPGSVANYIDNPKENGYQSFHVKLLSDQGMWEEVHISSERMVRASRLGCTAERTEANVSQWIEKFKEILQDVAFHSKDMDYMDGVTASFYNDDILVFTPKGKGIILPKGATALDFAYEIHSKIGQHAVYARINGKLMSVKTVLHRGDCVEIGTDENSCPDADWIDHVLTYKAKRHLRSYLSSVSTIEYQRCPHCHPLPGDEVIGFKAEDGKVTLHKRNCPTAIRMASQQGDSILAIEFEENGQFLYPVRVQIRAVDRYHLLSDLIDCITNKLHLSISKLSTETIDHIAVCTIDFAVHSASELDSAIKSISAIKSVDEVHRVDIE
ncbi:MAG: bifunctional (p)ppGpp synthetase/guanosine-3',5'-bis(diphosphate) 3'-pyrophosphohydrolase [Bacteroidales bacterium]|nr:bifunctional (p)ppGpp synthetase/guanosine-3',5'-bis(diphosphate) 3'-pyrophosphohydrolase [Bacteroidales bacterium]